MLKISNWFIVIFIQYACHPLAIFISGLPNLLGTMRSSSLPACCNFYCLTVEHRTFVLQFELKYVYRTGVPFYLLGHALGPSLQHQLLQLAYSKVLFAGKAVTVLCREPVDKLKGPLTNWKTNSETCEFGYEGACKVKNSTSAQEELYWILRCWKVGLSVVVKCLHESISPRYLCHGIHPEMCQWIAKPSKYRICT